MFPLPKSNEPGKFQKDIFQEHGCQAYTFHTSQHSCKFWKSIIRPKLLQCRLLCCQLCRPDTHVLYLPRRVLKDLDNLLPCLCVLPLSSSQRRRSADQNKAASTFCNPNGLQTCTRSPRNQNSVLVSIALLC